MTVKEYLMQIAKAERHITMLKREIEDLHRELYPSGTDYSADRVQTTHDPDKFGSVIARIDETERRILIEINHLLDAKDIITSQLMQMPNPRTAQILQLRYVSLLKWEEIAVTTSTDLRWVYRLHGQGLVEFGNQFGDKLHKFAIKSHY